MLTSIIAFNSLMCLAHYCTYLDTIYLIYLLLLLLYYAYYFLSSEIKPLDKLGELIHKIVMPSQVRIFLIFLMVVRMQVLVS